MKLSLYSCQFLLMMLDQIRELSNMRLKSLELDLEVFDLRERLNTLFENTIIQAELKSLKMIIQIDQHLPKKVYSDKQKIYNVLFNLLTNAIKYTNQGHVTVRIGSIEKLEDLFQIDSKTKILGDFDKQIEVQFIVEDTGPGLSEDQQEHMFQLFGKAQFSNDRN